MLKSARSGCGQGLLAEPIGRCNKICTRVVNFPAGLVYGNRARESRSLGPRPRSKEVEPMLMRTDQLRDFDRLAQQLFGTAARPVAMPMDAYREGDLFIIRFDMPGTDRDSIDLTVEQNVLTVRAERPDVPSDGAEIIVAERSSGTFTRQLFLGETLDADDLSADY